MPLTINVGLSKKIGQPDYGSLGATCNVEFEGSHGLLDDLETFHQHVRNAYIACTQAVNDELARQQQAGVAVNGSPNGHAAGNGTRANGNGGNGRRNGSGNGQRRSGGRRATASQVRAIHAITSREGFDLTAELRNQFGIERPEDLSITEASGLIDDLKARASGQDGR